MSDIAIKVENLSKQYRIGLKEQIPETFVGAMTGWLKAPLANYRQLQKLSDFSDNGQDPEDIIWALKDVSFEVKTGEVIGLIGRNGAGKSTLLKVLTRITEPTVGRITINGRVSSLLEVGTGFHPELTGRENIYLNSTILGMSKKEVDRKFDEIVDFAEMSKFVDTPVKRYSSGMKVRLAFSVAAHLEPEVLLIDEVLAVGDAAFQKKCLGKMEDVAKGGRTIVFVSHNMTTVLALCTKAYWLNNGMISYSGQVDDTINRYIQSVSSTSNVQLIDRKDRKGNGDVLLVSMSVENADGGSTITSLDRLHIKVKYRAKVNFKRPRLSVSIMDYTNVFIYRFDSDATAELPESLPAEGEISCITEPVNLMPGQYYMNVAIYISNKDIVDYIQYAYRLDVETVDIYGTGKLPGNPGAIGLIGQTWSSES